MAPLQRALLLPSRGAPFTLGTRPIPKPDPGQVLVKIESTALNPLDHYMQQFGVLFDSFPGVAGSDAAGTVEELGKGVTSLQKGDRVVFQSLFTADRGTFQQYALADATRTAKLPKNISFDDASTLPLGLASAAVGLYASFSARGGAGLTPRGPQADWESTRTSPRSSSAGPAPSGNSLLKLSGFDPIISTASAKNFDYVKAAGATHVIDYHTTPYSSLASAVKRITRKPVPLVYDAISTEDSQEAAWALLAPGGNLVLTLQSYVGRLGQVLEDGKRVMHVFGNVNVPMHAAFGDELYAAIPGLLENGGLKPNKVELLKGGLAGVAEGAERLRRHEGKYKWRSWFCKVEQGASEAHFKQTFSISTCRSGAIRDLKERLLALRTGSNMHRCLRIQEIVDLIVGALDTPRNFTEENRVDYGQRLRRLGRPWTPYGTLAALARTSKQFTERSLDLLWRDLDSLVPVCVVLGMPLSYFRPGQAEAVSCEETEPVELFARADPTRVLYYLRRVRHLYTDGSELTGDILLSLFAIKERTNTPLLPNLQTLYWDIELEDFQEESRIFDGPYVTRLSIHPSGILDWIAPAFPNLTEIEFISSRSGTGALLGPLSHPITSFSSLAVVDCYANNITADAFYTLAAMPSLREFYIAGIPHDVRIPKPEQHQLIHQPFFSSLCRLKIRFVLVDTCCTLLHALDNPNALQQLHVGYPESHATTYAKLEALLSCIAALCSQDTLSDLAITKGYDEDLEGTTFIDPFVELCHSPWALLQPLLRFSNIEHCTIQLPAHALDSYSIEHIASAYPHLTTLSLLSLPDRYRDLRWKMPLRSLYVLAERCPKLEHVEVDWLTAASDEDLGIRGLQRTWDHERKWGALPPLDIAASGVDFTLIAHARDVERFVKDLFPNIEGFSESRIFHHVRSGPYAEI
ncbi:hypothetical protein EVG20_g4637 [Dentipellis fragilis]|uniref:Enoyl reductase (ER) domain-containing protein n=1 Tax=Dentipellis fragilis TaxID=205917 RepID=A0A4Y9YV51_9AGAM|nr:hypothetical protein EVG20_g4637 [Dentipellis fragilis]